MSLGSEENEQSEESFVNSINDAVSEEEEKIREKMRKEGEMMEKAKELKRARSERKELEEREDDLKDELREFVKQNPSGHSSKTGKPFWKIKDVKVALSPNVRYKGDPKPFVEIVGAKQALPYMKIESRSKVKKALEDLSEEDLEKIYEKKEYDDTVKVKILDS